MDDFLNSYATQVMAPQARGGSGVSAMTMAVRFNPVRAR